MFESSTISTILAWLFVLPVLLYLVIAPLGLIFDNELSIGRRILYSWLLLCLLILSPLRYGIFQIALTVTFPVQSWGAFFSSFVAAVYVPIILGLLYVITLGIPVGGTALVEGTGERRIRWRIALAALVAPVLCIASWIPFTFLLPLAGKTVQWLDPVALVRATNGPAYYAFKYVALPGSPMQFPVAGEEIARFRLSDRDLARLHVASVYMSAPKEGWYIREAHPALFEYLVKKRSAQ